MTAPATPRTTPWKYLEPNPKSAYKQLFIQGTRIRARVLYGEVVNEEEPRTPEQIAEDYGLPIEAVREAIAYCQGNPPEIEDDFRREEALAEATGMNDPNYRFHGKPKILSAQEMARIDRQRGYTSTTIRRTLCWHGFCEMPGTTWCYRRTSASRASLTQFT